METCQLTIRRMRNGDLVVMSGDKRVEGLLKVLVSQDHDGSYTVFGIANQCLHLEVEPIPPAELN